jgi:hypothetical protein
MVKDRETDVKQHVQWDMKLFQCWEYKTQTDDNVVVYSEVVVNKNKLTSRH